MAETPAVCHSLHMPLQSGSDAVLRAMRRSYRRDRYLGILDKVRAAMPDAAITTDIIVGFPGETEADFEQTLDVVARRRAFAGAFTFQYSHAPRHAGRRAWTARCRARSCRSGTSGWSRCRTRSSLAANRALVGSTVEVLVAEGEGRKDAATGRRSGRARDGRLVHFACDVDDERPAGRRGHHRGDVRGAAPPGRRRAAAVPPAHRGRRRVRGRPPADHPGRPARHADASAGDPVGWAVATFAGMTTPTSPPDTRRDHPETGDERAMLEGSSTTTARRCVEVRGADRRAAADPRRCRPG